MGTQARNWFVSAQRFLAQDKLLTLTIGPTYKEDTELDASAGVSDPDGPCRLAGGSRSGQRRLKNARAFGGSFDPAAEQATAYTLLVNHLSTKHAQKQALPACLSPHSDRQARGARVERVGSGRSGRATGGGCHWGDQAAMRVLRK